MSNHEVTLEEEVRSVGETAERAPALFMVLEAERPLSGGARYSLMGIESVTLGRGRARHASRSDDGRSLDVHAPGRWISSRHAELRAVGREWVLTDVGSRNGTFVNGRRVSTATVREGDVFEVGRIFFTLRGAPTAGEPTRPDDDSAAMSSRFGFRTLLPELEEAYAALARVARRSVAPVLLLGPTGSGKEVLASELHAQSERPGAFVAVNCGAIPPTLVESLLFGYVRGAFSGADRDKAGFLQAADRGTLLLDEIGDLPTSSQAALLRVLQENEVVPIGATRAIAVDVRVVAATHRSLPDLVSSGAFRADLLARLKGYTHEVPPLRERMPDFGVLLAHIFGEVAKENASRLTLSSEAARALLAYQYPHNIRELHQAMRSAVALAVDDVIEARHLPKEILAPAWALGASKKPAGPDGPSLRETLIALLQENCGNVTAVARVMGKGPTQIHRWIHRFEIEVDTFRRS